MNAELFARSVEELGITLSSVQLEQFERFEERLYAANEVMNLTRVSKADCWLRHFLDSLLIQDLIAPNLSVLDIGSGPGFPAWPLACARTDLKITALDSNGKMLGFLLQNHLPNLEAVNARAEEFDRRETFDFVTGRAVAPLSAQLEISAALCRVGGQVVPMRSASDEGALESVDLTPLGLRLDRIERRTLPGTDAKRLFPIYEKVGKTKRGYPRRWAEIKRQPL